MTDTAGFSEVLSGIASRINEGMSEKDVENAFLNEGFYANLGYEGAGYDLRSEWSLPDRRRPDYVTLDDNELVTAVYEFKTTGRELSSHEDQLFHYVTELKADYGVLTNGEEFRLYRRDDRTPMVTLLLQNATESAANNVQAALRKPEWDITDPDSITAYLESLDEVGLDSELGREHFFDTFRLEKDSPFANLVVAMTNLLEELRDEEEAKFVKGAYDFWEASYADVPDKVPDSWEPFIDGKQSLRDFMFSLESGHALLARLLLAKATEDHDFFPRDRGLERYFNELDGGFNETINLDAYPIAANGMIEEMRNQLVESLFEDDIFIWWTDGYGKQIASRHHDPFSRFRDVAQSGSNVTKVSPATRERFSRAVAHITFAVLKFDFSRIEGDPLGDLYQRYFDSETRKALGEFYTPHEVVEYIMNSVAYDVGVSGQRLIDPSCGSGTFLVEAVERYLDDVRRYNDNPDWAKHLTNLCTRPHIVGLDIHPFAVLMAQIRFMVAILPEYRQAKRENESFTIRRLPIFRTDTLRDERELTGQNLGEDGSRQMTWDAITEDNQDIRIPVPLPIEVEEKAEQSGVETERGFLVKRIRMPLFDTIELKTGVSNFGEYFAALQGVLDVVKYHMHEDIWEYQGGLQQGIDRYTTREYDGIEEFFKPYVNDMLAVVRALREDYDDGRLFKMFEDTVLALVVKNYMDYDYVVGNPPYVNIKNISDSYQEYYQSAYESAFGRFDLYVLFIERGLKWLTEDGILGYITSNKFTRSQYGQEIRRIISSEYSLAKYVDFGDSGVFDDAVNYPCIMIVDQDKHREMIPYARIYQNIPGTLDTIEKNLNQDLLTESLEISDFPSSDLNEESWTFTSKAVRDLADKIQSNSQTTLGEVSLGIRQGVSPGRDEAFILSADEAAEKDLEQEILYSIIRGKSVRRWKVQWDGDVAIYPYDEEGYTGVDQYPNIKSHLDSYEEELRTRFCVQERGRELYGYDEYRPKSVFEGDFKIAVPDMARRNHFTSTDEYRLFKNTIYLLTFSDDQPYSEDKLLGLLNSSVSEFMFKQMSPFVNDRYYRYKSQYLKRLPLPSTDSKLNEKVDSIVDCILNIESLTQKVEDFPESYIENTNAEVEYIDYTWQTTRRPVDASLEELDDGRFAVMAGRTDKLTAPQIDRGDTEEQKRRAQYVYETVNNRNVKKNEKISIPIPTTGNAVKYYLNALEEDRSVIEQTSIEELEAEIDEAVYDLFELTDEEQEIIEKYLEIF